MRAQFLILILFFQVEAFAHSTPSLRDSTIIAALVAAVELYKLDTGKYPTTEQGLNSLLAGNGGEGAREMGYISRLPKSEWGSELQYRYPGIRNTDGYDIWSLGRDGEPGGEGFDSDCGNWPDGFDECFNAYREPLHIKIPKLMSLGLLFAFIPALLTYLLMCLVSFASGFRGKEIFYGRHLASFICLLLVGCILFPILVYMNII